MTVWRNVRVYVCLLLVLALGFIVHTRGFGSQLGGKPLPITGPYQSEEAWIVGQIVDDILAMSVYSASRPARAVPRTPVQTLAGGNYRVPAGSSLRTAIDLNLQDDVWSPDAFAMLARAALGQRSSVPKPVLAPQVHPQLLDPTALNLVAANATVSRALAKDIRDARAHEAAALILGAFSLREPAGRFSDVRWALNRITAHLAMATALRGDTAPTVDGMIADAVRLALMGRQVQSLQRVDQLRQQPASAAIDAWTRAIEMRITDDWRRLSEPAAASLLERQEYFRARLVTLSGSSAQLELKNVQADDSAEWLRLMQAAPLSVPDGWLVATYGLPLEGTEMAAVFEAMHHRALPDDPTAELNVTSAGCVTDSGPQVLSWSAWAEFFERQQARLIRYVDRFYRHQLNSLADAESAKKNLDRVLSRLTIYPIATAFRTRGPKGSEADLTDINDAIALAARSPERVTAQAWAFLEPSANYEAVGHGMPSGSRWFAKSSPRMPYDAAFRAARIAANDVAPLLAEAPYDFRLASMYLKGRYGDAVPATEIQRVLGHRPEYDLRAVASAKAAVTDSGQQEALIRHACDLRIGNCWQLADLLIQTKRFDEAADEYKRMFADPAFDSVAMSNGGAWLVNYYDEQGQQEAAIALADRVALVGSWRGMLTAAHLYERLDRYADAIALYKSAAGRYNNDAELIAFYFRAVNIRRQTEYEPDLKKVLAPVFPSGLVAPPSGQAKTMAHGVIVTKDNELVRKAGFQAGDIIVGLEGWRVDNLHQYRAINAIYPREEMKLTIWRGKIFDVRIAAPGRSLGVALRSYPIEGWAE